MLTPSPTRASTQLRSSKSKKTRRRGSTTRVMDVEMGTFTPLVFGTNGGMGLDCQNFLRTLANKLSTKNDEPYASVISWLRIQLSFAIFRSVHKCVRGSRDIHSNHVRSQKTSPSLWLVYNYIHNFRTRLYIVFFCFFSNT